jgi:hypothetical protein
MNHLLRDVLSRLATACGRLGKRRLKMAGFATFVKRFHKSLCHAAVDRNRVPRIEGKEPATEKRIRFGL